MLERRLKLWQVMFFVAIIVFYAHCRGIIPFQVQAQAQTQAQTYSGHTWDECPISEFELVNITDPELDADPLWDHVLLDFKSYVPFPVIKRIASEIGLEGLKPTSHEAGRRHKVFRARVPEGAVPRIHAHIKTHLPHYYRLLNSVEEEFMVRALPYGKTNDISRSFYKNTPDDPLYQYQWNFDQVQVEKAWSRGITGKGQVVAVIDTGVAPPKRVPFYPEYTPLRDFETTSFVEGYDFINKRTFAGDDNGHGTHVAGTIAQSTGNGYGVAGLAYDSVIMPIKVLGRDGTGSSGQVADGIRFAADHGAHIINLSLGSSRPSKVIEEAVKYAQSKGVLIIAAAGNSGKKAPEWPAAFEGVMAVAATQYDGHTAFYSQWGPFIDIAAPGGNVRLDQDGDGRPDGIMQETVKDGQPNEHEFALYMGTSMATPHVAGAAALVRSLGITNPEAIRKILERTASQKLKEGEGDGEEGENAYAQGEGPKESYPSKEFEERFGSGTLEAGRAVSEAVYQPGKTRVLVSLLVSLALFLAVRRERFLESNVRQLSLFLVTSVLISSGFFFLYGVIPSSLVISPVRWEFYLLGSSHLTFLSAGLPLLGISLFNGTQNLRYVAFGVTAGLAGFYFAEAYLLTAPLWGLGTGILARTALIVSGSLLTLLAYMGLR